ncbi:MAG: hypothetical protein KA178_09160 [Alphaproteobacteria bacterium]|nr:hypothetical protein [Alphaproteobacteria bacterium]MBP7759409.1 hypothetical protein [Alphaproteobacteria bacterium]MBP7762686.1 hypothetical protein [Alphaproteobacteria bacterium]
MARVDVERLDFVDVSQKTRGNFMEPENITRFLNTEVGKAQERLMRDQMAAQMNVDVTDKSKMTKPGDISTDTIRRALFTEQASQDQGYRSPDLTTAALMDKAGPSWYVRMFDSFKQAVTGADQTIRDGTRVGADATATMVTNNSGYSGQAAAALSGREAQIENAVNQALGVTPGGRKP